MWYWSTGTAITFFLTGLAILLAPDYRPSGSMALIQSSHSVGLVLVYVGVALFVAVNLVGVVRLAWRKWPKAPLKVHVVAERMSVFDHSIRIVLAHIRVINRTANPIEMRVALSGQHMQPPLNELGAEIRRLLEKHNGFLKWAEPKYPVTFWMAVAQPIGHDGHEPEYVVHITDHNGRTYNARPPRSLWRRLVRRLRRSNEARVS